MHSRLLLIFPATALAALCGGCLSLGPRVLRADQVDYAWALGDAKKRQILANIVGLRYADAPAVLTASQIIAAYQFDAGAGATVNSWPDPGGPRAEGTGTISYANHPTFTFTPTTGEAYAAAYIRPLPAALFLPLANSQTPIDLLLRITAQSIGNLQNATSLGGPGGNGSPGFFDLLRVLRRLQLAGALSIEYRQRDNQVLLAMAAAPGQSEQVSGDIARARELIGLKEQANPYGFSYGNDTEGGTAIPLVTRSVLGILGNLGAEIQVPDAAVARGATKPTIQLVGGEARPTIIVHAGRHPPRDAYVAVTYNGAAYWIDRDDFDSKYAFTIVQNLMALAESSQDSKAPIVTIPAS